MAGGRNVQFRLRVWATSPPVGRHCGQQPFRSPGCPPLRLFRCCCQTRPEPSCCGSGAPERSGKQLNEFINNRKHRTWFIKWVMHKICLHVLSTGSGFETCFGWDPPRLRCCDYIAKHILNLDAAPLSFTVLPRLQNKS